MDIYDINILKRNISRITKERNITQSELAAATGMQQPAISKILSCNDSSCFSIQQLVNIANYLHESVDTLLGVTPITEPQKETSLSDLCLKLFELDEIQNIEIGICETGEYEIIDDIFSENPPIKTECMFFKNKQISKILKEWKEVKSPGSLSEQTKEKIVQLWKDDALNENKTRMKKWEFRNKKEQARHLAEEIIDAYYRQDEFPFLEVNTKDNFALFKDYMDSGEYCLDFDHEDWYILENFQPIPVQPAPKATPSKKEDLTF